MYFVDNEANTQIFEPIITLVLNIKLNKREELKAERYGLTSKTLSKAA